jgi:hypothetical protein
MAVIEGGSSAALMGVGSESASPGHTSRYPIAIGSGGGGYYRVGPTSGTMAAALAANAEIFQFRYVTAASRTCIVQKVTISAGANVAATAAAILAFKMTVARAWTAAGTGGTRLTLTGNNAKLRTSYSTSEINDAGISTTAALAAGTKTLDTTDVGGVAFGVGTGAITTALPLTFLSPTILYDADGEGQHPLVLANQEGFVVRNGAVAFPAAMTWNFTVNVLWGEVANY